MTPIRLLASSVAAVSLASCAGNSSDNNYDTSNPYGVADSGNYQTTTPAAPSNPVYDTPAAYEESTGTTPAPEASSPNLPAPPHATAAKPSTTPARPTQPRNSAAPAGATTHVVVKGDSLWSISKKYNVPTASIKAANNMTTDVAVLGKKLIIPAH